MHKVGVAVFAGFFGRLVSCCQQRGLLWIG